MVNHLERLAVEQAVYNAIGADLKKGVTHNLRGEFDAYYLDQYEHSGAKSFDVRVGGRKVGTASISRRKGKPGRIVRELQMTSLKDLQAWEDPDFDAFCAKWVLAHIDVIAAEYVSETGELPDGMDYVDVCIPDEPEGPPTVTYRPSADFVSEARDWLLNSGVAGLLGGGGDV